MLFTNVLGGDAVDQSGSAPASQRYQRWMGGIRLAGGVYAVAAIGLGALLLQSLGQADEDLAATRAASAVDAQLLGTRDLVDGALLELRLMPTETDKAAGRARLLSAGSVLRDFVADVDELEVMVNGLDDGVVAAASIDSLVASVRDMQALVLEALESFSAQTYANLIDEIGTARSALTALHQEIERYIDGINAASAARVDNAVVRVLWSIVAATLVGVVTSALAVRQLRRLASAAAASETAEVRSQHKSQFESALNRALEMAKDEQAVIQAVSHAMKTAAPGRPFEVLVADESKAHLEQVLSEIDEGCAVRSPDRCPAIAGGRSMSFPTNAALDACPNLKRRSEPCSALCAPVSIAGATVGVVHIIGPDMEPLTPAVRSDVELVVGRTSDRITMLRAFQAAETRASTDPLTGCINRRSLETSMRSMAMRSTPYTLAFADLDHFKLLNDVHGHAAGDRALRLFSATVRDCLRPGDLLCRFGGEEFVVVLPNCNMASAVPVLDRMRERLAEAHLAGTVPEFTFSAGLAESSAYSDFDAVLAAADGALLRAKSEGRDRLVFDNEAPRDHVATIVDAE